MAGKGNSFSKGRPGQRMRKNESVAKRRVGKRDNSVSSHDVFDLAEETDKANLKEMKKFEDVDIYEYELPSDFEDEEIPEDEAFGDDDDNFDDLVRGKKPNNKRRDESESEEEDEDEEDGEYENLSDLLDRADDEEETQPKAQSKKTTKNHNFDEDDEDDEDDQLLQDMSSEDDEDQDDDDDDEEDDDERHNNLLSTLIKTSKQDDNNKKRSNNKRRNEMSEMSEENEFNLKGEELSLADLMGTLSSDSTNSQTKAQLERIQKRSNSKGGVVSAPLPTVVVDRMKRQEGYKQSKKDVSKWTPFVHQVARSENVTFPLVKERVVMSQGAMIKDFHPVTEMEQDIENLLKESGMDEESLMKSEELELNKLSTEEVEKRQAELAKMRSLLFYKEIKAKHKKKIKSKTYHKHMKRREEKEKLSLEELNELDPELAQEQLEKAEVARIRERMTLRHSKNQSSFSRNARMNASADEGTREAVHDQLRLREKLKQKMNTIHSDSDDSDNDDSDDNNKEEEEEEDEEEEEKSKKPKLFQMKFMERAMERDKKDADQDDYDNNENNSNSDDDEDRELTHAEMIIKSKKQKKSKNTNNNNNNDGASAAAVQLLRSTGLTEHVGMSAGVRTTSSSSVTVDFHQKSAPAVPNVFQPVAFPEISLPQQKATPVAPNSKNINIDINKKSATTNKKNKKQQQKQEQEQEQQQQLEEEEKEKEQQEQQAVEEQKNKKSKRKKQQQIEEEEDNNDKQEDNDNNNNNPWMQMQSEEQDIQPGTTKGKGKVAKEKRALQQKDKLKMKEDQVQVDLDAAIRVTNNNNKKNKKGNHSGNGSFNLLGSANDEQKELIKQAFVTDDIEEEFENERRITLGEDLKQPEDTTLPGWGAWGGEGVTQRPRKNRKLEAALAERDAEMQKRLKSQPKDVIIRPPTANQIKTAQQYMVDHVPYPFKTREQYELSLQTPLGKQFNTNAVYSKNVKQSVYVTPGTMIQPISQQEASTLKKRANKRKEQQTATKLSGKRIKQ